MILLVFPSLVQFQTLVWKALSKTKQDWFENVNVQFEDLRFLKPTVLSPEGKTPITILSDSFVNMPVVEDWHSNK